MFGRKKKEDWWQQTGEEQNAAAAQAVETAAPAPADTADNETAAAEQSPETEAESSRQKKHRWAWLDAAGDILEVVIDFITELFD